jgi:hypothetical protein
LSVHVATAASAALSEVEGAVRQSEANGPATTVSVPLELPEPSELQPSASSPL